MLNPVSIDSQLPVAVFLGPTLALPEARRILPANYLPPVRLGDLYALLATSIETVVIIDGLFDGTTPVWQREILAVLESGRQVFGASSMGALRATELSPYGMQGFGQVFEWYRDGVIDGDDEVALLHGVEELDYVKVSEPLINIRYTLRKALEAGVLSPAHHDSVIATLKASYFGERSFTAVMSLLQEADGPVEALMDFVKEHHVDLKKQDAKDLLEALAAGSIGISDNAGAWFQRARRFGSYMHCTELRHGAAQMLDGHLVSHQTLLVRLTDNWSHYRRLELLEIEHFYLTRCLASTPAHDDAVEAEVLDTWCRTHGIDDLDAWLRTAGMEQGDWVHRVLNEQAIDSMLQQLLNQHDPITATLVDWLQRQTITSATRKTSEQETVMQAVRIVCIARWAMTLGYELPDGTIDYSASAGTLLASSGIPDVHIKDPATRQMFNCFAWLLLDGPVSFGYRFDPVSAVYRRLQMQGRIHEIRSHEFS